MIKKQTMSDSQAFFYSMFSGVLLYSVVLGFFNDYTDILHTGTYSITFSLAIVMQALTYATFKVKDWVVVRFKGSERKLGLVFSVWLVMFFSKFVFLWVIGIVFSDDVQISGFIGLLVIIICLTLVQNLAELVYKKLGQKQ